MRWRVCLAAWLPRQSPRVRAMLWSHAPLCPHPGFWATSGCLLTRSVHLLADLLCFGALELHAWIAGASSENLTARFHKDYPQHEALLQDSFGLVSLVAWLMTLGLVAWHVVATLRRLCRAPEVLFFPDPSGVHVRHVCLLLRGARRRVWVAMFALTDDVLSEELLRAWRRGVDVKVVVDDEQCRMPGADAQKLLDAGVPLLLDDSPARMHHKFAIVDSCLLTGSFNWTKQASTTNWENLCILRDAAAVASFAAEFQSLWRLFQRKQHPGKRKRDATPKR